MNESPKPFIPPYRCFDCGSEVGFRSRRRTLTERLLLPLFLLQPVRCGECFRRDYRLIFTPVHERLSDASQLAVPKIVPAKHRSTSDRNVA
jgi:DNA-directed RNA polymerase subunit N (RpoN/RPB10)